MYFWENEYEELYTCLESQGFPKDSSYCLKKYDYLIGVEMQKPEAERGSIEDIKTQRWDCLSKVWSITKDVKDCASNIAAGGATKLVYPALSKEDYTVTYSQDPVAIANTGDKTLLQQSYFIGAAVKFYNDKKPETEAGYIITGNYPDIGNTLKYGKMQYYP